MVLLRAGLGLVGLVGMWMSAVGFVANLVVGSSSWWSPLLMGAIFFALYRQRAATRSIP